MGKTCLDEPVCVYTTRTTTETQVSNRTCDILPGEVTVGKMNTYNTKIISLSAMRRREPKWTVLMTQTACIQARGTTNNIFWLWSKKNEIWRISPKLLVLSPRIRNTGAAWANAAWFYMPNKQLSRNRTKDVPSTFPDGYMHHRRYWFVFVSFCIVHFAHSHTRI